MALYVCVYVSMWLTRIELPAIVCVNNCIFVIFHVCKLLSLIPTKFTLNLFEIIALASAFECNKKRDPKIAVCNSKEKYDLEINLNLLPARKYFSDKIYAWMGAEKIFFLNVVANRFSKSKLST
jgi:hypothetical protein